MECLTCMYYVDGCCLMHEIKVSIPELTWCDDYEKSVIINHDLMSNRIKELIKRIKQSNRGI